MTPTIEPISLPEIAIAIRTATEEVFSVMLGIDLEAAPPVVGRAAQGHSGVVAVLGLTGAWGGSGELSADLALARTIASKLLMAPYDDVNEDVLDAIAEVANMVIGNVKNTLEETLGAMRLSVPAVFFGGEFETRVAGKANMVFVPFSCAEGALSIQIAVAPLARTRLAQRHEVQPQLVG